MLRAIFLVKLRWVEYLFLNQSIDQSINILNFVSDVSDEEESNWMRFARSAERYSEQNLIVGQDRGQLYFTSTRTINPRQELRVWYSPEYAEARGLKVLRPSPEDLGKFFLDYLFIYM